MHLKRIGRELRRQLYERYRRKHSQSRSRSPYRHKSYDYDDRHHGRHSSRRYDDRESYYESRSKRHRSTSPHRRGRSRSPPSRRDRSPIREGSEERRAKIEQWNREKEEAEHGGKTRTDYEEFKPNGEVKGDLKEPAQRGDEEYGY